jgi:hypothetical protein
MLYPDFITADRKIDVNLWYFSSDMRRSEASCKYGFSDKRGTTVFYLKDAGSTNLLNFKNFLPDKVQLACSSEKSLNIWQTTRHLVPKDSNFGFIRFALYEFSYIASNYVCAKCNV